MKHKIILKNHLEDILYKSIGVTTNTKHNTFKNTDIYLPYIVLHLKKIDFYQKQFSLTQSVSLKNSLFKQLYLS